MRIDKYIWAIRVFKTRSLASESCRAGKVTVDGEVVKTSRTVKIGNAIAVRKGAITFSWKVLEIPRSRVGAKLVPDYAIETTTEEEKEKLELIRLSHQSSHRRGLGRPTKRDRRDIDKYFK